MVIDWSKPVETKSGLPARVLCTDACAETPVIALVKKKGREEVMNFTIHGVCSDSPNHNLINIPKIHEVWLNIYHKYQGGFYADEELHEDTGKPLAIARIKVSFKEGEGLADGNT